MKGIFKIGLKVLKIADKALIGGAVTNVLESTETHPKGKVDYKKLIETIAMSSIPIVLLIMLATGVITMEQLKELFKIFN